MSLAEGSVLDGRYRIERLLGEGGMGAVYEAVQLSLGRRVAVKVIKQRSDVRAEARDRAAEDAVQRFARETEAVARLQHPNIVGVLDAGRSADGVVYLAMELLQGQTMRRALRDRGALAVERALEIAHDVAGALAAAHAAGVIHRDLKAENVMIVPAAGKPDHAKVLDFGIARVARSGGEPITQTGAVAGTPGAIAPEQMSGTADDPRSDLYALGVLLFESIAGAPPFCGATPLELLMRHMTEPPPRLSSRVPFGVAPALDALVASLLAKSPGERPASAEAVAVSLRNLQKPGASEAARTATATDVTRVRSLEQARGSLEPVRALAVLPLKNLGPAEDAYLADGATDDLTDALSMSERLRVRPRGAVVKAIAGDVDAQAVGRALDVGVVVEGSLRRSAQGVLLTVRVVNVADGFQIWARRFEAPLTDLLVRTDEAARAIGDALQGGQVARPAPRAAVDDVAMELYLQARASMKRNWYQPSGTWTDTFALFQSALARAPADGLVLSGYATAVGRFAQTPGELSQAFALAERAVAAAPSLAEPWIARALVHRRNLDIRAMLADLVRALRASPGHGQASYLVGRLLLECSSPERAVPRFERALSVDASDVEAKSYLGLALAAAHDFAGAARVFADDVRGLPNEALFDGFAARVALWTRIPSAPSLVASPASELLRAALRDPDAVRALDEPTLRARLPAVAQRPAYHLVLLAELHGFLGRAEACAAVVAEAEQAGNVDVVWLERCPLLDDARALPAFAEAAARMTARVAPVRAALAELLPLDA